MKEKHTKEIASRSVILSHLINNTKSFSSLYLHSGFSSIPRHHDFTHCSYLQNMYVFCPFSFGHDVFSPAAATMCPSSAARFYAPELNTVASFCFPGSTQCQEFLGRRSESNLVLKKMLRGWGMYAITRGAPEEIITFLLLLKYYFSDPIAVCIYTD